MAVIVFAAMWESDARPEHSSHTLARRAEQRARLVDSDRDGRSRTVPLTVGALPEGIPTGRYLVADTSGQVRRIQLIASSTVSATSPVRDQYTLRDGDTTTYCIRIRSESRASLAAREEEQRH